MMCGMCIQVQKLAIIFTKDALICIVKADAQLAQYAGKILRAHKLYVNKENQKIQTKGNGYT